MSSISTFDRDAVEQFADTFEKLFYDNDGSGMAAYYTDDARLFAEGIPPTQGRSAIEAFWQATCARGKTMGMKRVIRVDEVQATGELCYAYCTLTLDMVVNGQQVHRTTSDITIWRKQDDDSWQIEVDISVPDPQPEAIS